MNRKIFTLLASALMLFSTAFYVNARSVAEKSVGDLVKTLPEGTSSGMYHLQIDSICLPDYVAYPGTTYPAGHPLTGQPLTGRAIWIPVTADNGTPSISNPYFQYSDGSPGLAYDIVTSSVGFNDTMILSVTEGGYVAMISASDLRAELFANKAKLLDLQATMWCTNVEDASQLGQWPTYHFTNKVFGQDLDWKIAGNTQLDGEDKGWMYSPSYTNGQLKQTMPFYRHEEAGKYNVIAAALDNDGKPTGLLQTKKVNIDSYIADTVVGMLKFSVVKISPFVMTAEDFNTQLGNTAAGKVSLSFDPVPVQTNYFGYQLKAYESKGADAKLLGYLNVEAYDEDGKALGFIANSNTTKTQKINSPKEKDPVEKYNNIYGIEYLNLFLADGAQVIDTYAAASNGSAADINKSYNASYRFVYFPSEDSLVINAYHVRHDGHSEYASTSWTDNGDYVDDVAVGTTSFYYGLYNDEIHDALTVRYQDVNGIGGASSLMTIGKHPSNVRIYFGINSCTAQELEGWKVPKGVYTIWDTEKRVLGVRIYNGSYAPQWIDLDPGECPDRIPSYQWVVEHVSKDNNANDKRVRLVNREFGDLSPLSGSLVCIDSILVRRGESQIFRKKTGQFLYDPIMLDLQQKYGYEPIFYGYVNGQLIAAPGPMDCVLESESGFRPVTNEYLADQYLGYKHFEVDSDPTSVGYGKSEDIGNAKGMDYNAYAFNYLYYGEDNGYIDLKSNYNDSILHISTTGKTGFQFMLGSYIRTRHYKEEEFGYPRAAEDARVISDPERSFSYAQTSVPVLKRYYYELKVADFYNFRDGLSEEFVVLKGAKEDGSDIKNALKYGVADIYAGREDFKFANLYLRESYFLERPVRPEANEERHPADPTRRIYYVLLDRIEEEQLDRVTSLGGFEVSDTLKGDDGTSRYNLVTVKVEDAYPSFLKAQGKTVSTARASAFSLENVNYPLYRRLRSIRDDGATPEGDGVDPTQTTTALDAPKTLRIHRHANYNHFLHEDALSDVAYNYGINFLGHSNIIQNPEEIAPDGLVKYNYHLFIDTAFINRGTGWIKPQYLIAVDQEVVKAQTVAGVDWCGDPTTRPIQSYVKGRYLINATDSARIIGSNGSDGTPARDDRYIYKPTWDRLAFVPAIHTDDRLYIISELEKHGITENLYTYTSEVDGKKYLDASVLRELTKNYAERTPKDSRLYALYYDFGTWNNYHNDVCFSLRFTKPGVTNPDENGDDVSSNEDKRFFIESETTNRTATGNRKIAPVQGGWVKLENFVPVLSRTAYQDDITNAEIFNVALPTDWQDGKATSNEEVAAKFNVVAGYGSVTVQNAAGKQVSIKNLLGQTILEKKLDNNSETIPVAKGIVIVNVEGEAVKALVK